MTWTDLSRRAATVFLVVLCLLTVPAVASAKFVSPQTVSLSVGTARMDTPTAVFGVYSCERGSRSESIQVTVISFKDGGPDGAAYSYRLTRGSTTADSAYSGLRFAMLGASKSRDSSSTTWTVSIQSTLRNWTGDAYTTSITCPASGNRDGFL